MDRSGGVASGGGQNSEGGPEFGGGSRIRGLGGVPRKVEFLGFRGNSGFPGEGGNSGVRGGNSGVSGVYPGKARNPKKLKKSEKK